MTFDYPMFLWLLPTLPLLWFFLWGRQGKQGVAYSHLPLLKGLPVSARQQWLWLPLTLQVLALGALLVAVAQPVRLVVDSTEQKEGIAMAIVLDVSSSMKIRMDVQKGVQKGSYKERKSRLSVAKQVLERFILGEQASLAEGSLSAEGSPREKHHLQGRGADLISLVTFARFPRVVSPLTSSHESLVFMAREVEPPTVPDEDGTAFGDATALAAAQLSEYEKNYGLKEKVKSKILILLTDGENNAGDFSPAMAAEMARDWGIRVYTIFIGNPPGKSLGDQLGIADSIDNTEQVDWVLQAMADRTGGVYQRAHDYDSLTRVYEAIDQLETSRLQTLTFEERIPAFHWAVLLALLALLVAAALNATWLRRLG